MKIRSWLGYQNVGQLFVNEKKGIFIVVKGFGSNESVSETEKSVIATLREFLEKESGDLEATLPFIIRHYYSLAGNVIYNAILHANKKLYLENQAKPFSDRVGCSVLVGLTDQGIVAVANAGATSLWLMRENQMKEIAPPRSYSRMAHPFEVDTVAGKDVPMMALGMNENLEPEISEYKLYHGDAVWVQSAGFKAEQREQVHHCVLNKSSVLEQIKNTESLFNSMPYSIGGSGALIVF